MIPLDLGSTGLTHQRNVRVGSLTLVREEIWNWFFVGFEPKEQFSFG